MMRQARAAAVVTYVYAAAFGLPAIPVAIYLTSRGALPTFMDLFPMYGGPWSSSMSRSTLTVLLIVFLMLLLIAAWSAWLLRRGSKLGAITNVGLLPAEAIFWIGFALPIPWIIGLVRAVLVAQAWKQLA